MILAKKRPASPPPGQPTAKRGKADIILPEVAFNAAGFVEKNLIIPVTGPLSGVEAGFIRVWKAKNPGYQVQLRYDPDAELAGELTRFIVQNAKLKTQPDLIRPQRFHSRTGEPLRYPDDDDIFRYRVISDKQQASER